MMERLWRNYWAGAWLLLAGLELIGIGFAIQRIDAKRLSGYSASSLLTEGLWVLGSALFAFGFVVWAYRYHTETD
jgi:drug/metabolite transporter (DMT)-like permease